MDANIYGDISGYYKSVSIHAPVMDANPTDQSQTPTDPVSIHAPVMDAKPYNTD